MRDILKAAVVGTEDYHSIMRQIAVNTIQHKAGYTPQTAARATPIPSVEKNFAACADALVQAITRNQAHNHCNRRSPYLWLVWLLVGSDNPYRTAQYVDDDTLLRQITMILIRIALGDVLTSSIILELIADVDAARFTRATLVRAIEVDFVTRDVIYALARAVDANADRCAACVVETLDDAVVMAVGDVAFNRRESRVAAIRKTLVQKMEDWAHIKDGQALQTARQLFWDALPCSPYV